MSPIVNHCQLQRHDPQSCITAAFVLMIFGQVLDLWGVCSGPFLGLDLADNVECCLASAVLKWLPRRERIQRI